MGEKPAENEAFELLRQGDRERIKELINQGLDVSRKDEDGASLLHYAVWYGYSDLVSLLIERGADAAAARNDGYTPLHWAAYRGRMDAARMLLNGGAEVDAAADTGARPLHLASWKGHTEVAELLLEAGASFSAEKTDGNTPFDLVTSEGKEETRRLLSLAREYGSKGGVVAYRYGKDMIPLYHTYGESLLSAIDEQGEKALMEGEPELPPYAESSLIIERSFHYNEHPVFRIMVKNTGRGSLFRLHADISAEPAIEGGPKKILFGFLAPGDRIVRTVRFPRLSPDEVDSEIELDISFSEHNKYTPPVQRGIITIKPVDKRFLFVNFFELPDEEIVSLVENGHIKSRELEEVISAHLDSIRTERFLRIVYGVDLSRNLIVSYILHKDNITTDHLVKLVAKEKIHKTDAVRPVAPL